MNDLEQVFDKFGKYVVQQGRTILTQGKHNASSKLYNSLRYEFKKSKNSIEWSFYAEDYAPFVDKGVKGVKSSSKAPNSPFKFGTGSGGSGLSEGIRGWVKLKRFQFRKPNGKFMSFDETASMISRSIWNKGLKPVKFLETPFERAYAKLPDEVVKGYGLEIDFVLQNLNK